MLEMITKVKNISKDMNLLNRNTQRLCFNGTLLNLCVVKIHCNVYSKCYQEFSYYGQIP